ncbi:KpsF/GutQ family sugar-phosphate isomerase [Alteromonas facilis]|uniref:KpsF/GutQ family sugar-phosphate isomerase n=1 Tax=Alteromonas facilis TaxID=2048004 RepID=UPI0023E7DEA8|nr:KpsF/GutQ family sugar-phosphate isomerase [Alteromonas facilis]
MADFIGSGKRVVAIEQREMSALSQRIDQEFVQACELCMACTGKVVVSGMGKSGHIGHKIAATLSSTGTPSFFMHPGEANHGDLGMLAKNDVLLAISNSGESTELISILPVVKRLQIPIIAMTNNRESTLAKHADVVLDISVSEEACSLGLAPTTSTTVTLVMGDALAVALLDAKGFTSDDFALSHPGGSLGRKLLLGVSDIMATASQLPLVDPQQSISAALLEISQKGLGMTGVQDESGALIGIFTDGDLRRILDARIDIHSTHVGEVMTKDSITVSPHTLAVNALNLMEQHKISAMFVVDEARKPVGAFNMHMLLLAGVL